MICQAEGLDKKRTKQMLRSFLVETGGLEPLTPCMSSRYSNQLSYASKLLLLYTNEFTLSIHFMLAKLDYLCYNEIVMDKNTRKRS